MADSTRRERKRERFTRLASQRTNAVLQRVRILANCSNSQLYEYSEDDVRKIFSAIEKEVRLAKAKFLDSGGGDFSL